MLKKLIALANNNPNEHEANLAARKVCKALIEHKYIDQLISVKEPVRQTTQSYYKGPKPDFDMNDFMKMYDELFKGRYKPHEPNYREPYYKRPDYGFKTGNNPDDEKYYQRRKERGFGDERRMLICKKCGNSVETKFIGIPEMFVCNSCIWNAYKGGL